MSGFHTFPVERADALSDPKRYARLSVEELLALFDPDPEMSIADLGSGTGFYTDHLATVVRSVYAVDLQPEMHARYRERGVPENVSLLTGSVGALPVGDSSLDALVSTMTYHEFRGADSLSELARVLVPGGRVAIADWSAAGAGEAGPPLEERSDAASASEDLEGVGFSIARAAERCETFVLSARR